MHLHYPSLSMSGKKKGKQKFPSAEAKQRYMKLEQEWAMLKNKHGVEQEEKKRQRALQAAPLKLDLGHSRVTQKIASKVTPGGNCAAKPIQEYTGTEMLGIGQLHKSNAVPVFRAQDAEDIARMRR